jgi:hypothetical protein
VYPEWENEVILPLLPFDLWAPCKARWVCPLQFAKASAATLSQQEKNNSADVLRGRANIPGFICTVALLVLLVNDSEYSQSAGAKLISSPSCIYLVSPGACCCCCGSCGFLMLLLCAPTPPRPPYFGGGKYKKIKSPVASAIAVGHVGVCVGVMRGRGAV